MDFWHSIPFPVIIWLLPPALVLHEVEEWSILDWYHRHFIDLPLKTDTSIRVFLVFMSLLGFVWTAIASLSADPRVTAFIISLLAVAVFLNALQHLYWLVAFQDYAPGVFTSVVLLIPIIVVLGVVVVQQDLLPRWYEVLMVGLVLLGLIQTVQARNRLTFLFRAINRFTWFLVRLLGLEAK